MTNESRHDRFKRLAEARTNEILKRLDILGNCSNKSVYEYTEVEINKIFLVIDRKAKEVKLKFKFSRKSKNDFKL